MKEAGRPVYHLPPASPAPTQCAGAPWPPSGPAARNASALPPAGLQFPVLWAVHTLCAAWTASPCTPTQPLSGFYHWASSQSEFHGRFPGGTSGKESACQCRRRRRQCVQFLGQEDLLKEEMATHPSILTWRIPWTG